MVQKLLNDPNLFELLGPSSTSFYQALSNRIGEIPFVMFQVNHMPHNHCLYVLPPNILGQTAEPCLCILFPTSS